MLKDQPPRRTTESDSSSKSSRGDGHPYKHAFDAISKSMQAAECAIVTSLPRGSLQIAQPSRFSEALFRGYTKAFHLEDKLTWQAILREHVITADDVFPGDGEDSRYRNEFMRPNGLAYAIAAPLRSPVLDGYAGALHVYRRGDDGNFNASERNELRDIARQLDSSLEKMRSARRGGESCNEFTLTPKPAIRQFIFDSKGKQVFGSDEFQVMDNRLRQQITEQARDEVQDLNGQLVKANRVQLPDTHGDLWTFRVVGYRKYPALGKGPFVLFCMQPSCCEWGTVRPSDLQADQELARLIPALKFMRSEFHRGPTLVEIAKQVHLSPFHFHRRFAELLGLTPKHYLLDCQIAEAKAQLLARKKELAEIATDCGFAHQSHFTSRFKQATGLTPTRWRRIASDKRSGR